MEHARAIALQAPFWMASITTILSRFIRVAAVTLALLPVAMIGWMQSRGDWQLSASNTPGGIAVDVYWGSTETPQYSTILPGHSIPRDIDRATHRHLPSDIGTTTFFDGTMRPGRWTVIIDGVELDIMEGGWWIDGTPVPPTEKTIEQWHAPEDASQANM